MPRRKMRTKKDQSAMEYLMTYGWAILIIAVVLGALFSLGVFSGNSMLGTACIAQTGFLCQSPVYQHTNGGITVTLGQHTGTSWTTANVMFVPEGQANSGGIPATMTQAAFSAGLGNVIPSGIGSGQSITVNLPVNGVIGSVNVGTAATGKIWVEYQTYGCMICTFQYAQMAAINVRAT